MRAPKQCPHAVKWTQPCRACDAAENAKRARHERAICRIRAVNSAFRIRGALDSYNDDRRDPILLVNELVADFNDLRTYVAMLHVALTSRALGSAEGRE